MKFTVVVTEDPEEEGIFNASVPALPGCHTWGATIKEAIANARDAIVTYLEASEIVGDPIPLEVANQMVTIR